jgi:5-dehydro-2-deoxygluconokinase
MRSAVLTALDLITIGRVSVDLYGQQIGSRLEDVATFAKAVGGCPANVAIGAARLGLKSALITRVGDEPMGRFVHEQLAREGVATRAVHVDPQRLTALVLLSVRDEHTFPLIFYRDNCADSALCEDDIDAELIASARAILVTGTHFSLEAAARAQRKAIEVASAHGRRVILDIDYRPNLWGVGGHGSGELRYARSAEVTRALVPILPSCNLIVGTEEEMHIAAGVEDTMAAIRRIRSLSNAVIVCKRGARGCVVFTGEIPAALEGGLVVKGFDIEVYNVLGAGDAFLAGYLQGYLRDAPPAESARLANACGALAVSRLLCSPEFPTAAELEYFLAHGSPHRALRQDRQLNHLHHVTTRRPCAPTLRVLAIAGPSQLKALSAAAQPPAEQLGRFEELAVQAVSRVAARRGGFGVLLDAAAGAAGLREAARAGLWIARSVQPRGSHALEFAAGESFALQLTEWPIEITVHTRCPYPADDPAALREAQERSLGRIAAVCRAQGREWLLEVCRSEGTRSDGNSLAGMLSRLQVLDIRPDWWALPPPPDMGAWQSEARLIAEHDGYCRGVLLALEATPASSASRALAAEAPLVRGFIAGASIQAQAATAWLAGALTDEAAVAEMAQRFGALVEEWSAPRHPELDPLQRSTN